nr:immunoglobulin light chain junction region [Macaca mulatta]MOX70007.1 immunoglobulin light chain junction region [Macaca mulatta]MOX71941.1 immunoglobulin light chain junction region [Macaca mulatta]MOX71966.1 immunoglobulin light chain junction region [Macaca mulatta]MOX72483.1 immunoglobulin light chain junction region [Macaca mulatta]
DYFCQVYDGSATVF